MFADRIKELRSKHKLTQKEFAERIGVSPTTIVSYEKGVNVPSYDILVRIAKEFAASLDELCDIKIVTNEAKSLTAADVVQAFDVLRRALLLKIDDFGERKNVQIQLCLLDTNMEEFINTYLTMANLLDKKQINQEIFDTWFNAKIQEFDSTPFSWLPF